MGKWNLSFGHLEGTTSNSKLVSSQFETSTKGLLVLLGNLAAVFGALMALAASLRPRKK